MTRDPASVAACGREAKIERGVISHLETGETGGHPRDISILKRFNTGGPGRQSA